MSKLIGLAVSDLQLSENPPIARSCEKDWLAIQDLYLHQLRSLSIKHQVPVLIAGDIFEKWNSSPNLISRVIKAFYGMEAYAIPGNHDLPNHSYTELSRSAYWTLVEAKAINHLTPGISYSVGEMMVDPFPYGFEVSPPKATHSLYDSIALIHSFIWTDKTGHSNASDSQRYAKWLPRLKGYCAAIFGDNHKGFTIAGTKDRPFIHNCGTFIRRHADEKAFKPRIGLIYQGGAVGIKYLDTTQDRFVDIDLEISGLSKRLQLDLSEFADELQKIQSERLDYAKTVILWASQNKVPDPIKNILLSTLGSK